MTKHHDNIILLLSLCLLSHCLSLWAFSVAVMDCAGSLAKLHPAAFITNMVPHLKDQIFTGSLLFSG